MSDDIELAKIKASIYGTICAYGSESARVMALANARIIYEWCIEHMKQAEPADKQEVKPRMVRPRKA